MKGALEKVYSQAENTLQTAVESKSDADRLGDFMFLLGGLSAVHTIANNLNAALISNLQRIRDEELYKIAGFSRFDQFLDEHPRSPMRYKKFNYIEGIFKTLGPKVFDLLSDSELSLRQQKLIQEGDVTVENGQMIVRGEGESLVLDIDNKPGWTDALLALANANAANKAAAARERKAREDAEQKLDRGQRDYDELQRNFDRLQGSDPYERSLGRALLGLLELTEAIGQLPDKTKAARGRDALPVLWAALQRAKDAYGTSFSFEDHQPMTGSELDAIAAQVLSGDD